MNIYNHQNKLKILLSVIGIIIVSASLWYTNSLVNQIRKNERQNMELWASTIVKKSQLVTSRDSLFQVLKTEERKRVAILGKAFENFVFFPEGPTFAEYSTKNMRIIRNMIVTPFPLF